MINELHFGLATNTHLSYISSPSSWNQALHMTDWLCRPKILYLHLLTVAQRLFRKKKEEAWTLQQQSTSVYAGTHLTHVHAHTHTAAAPSFDVSAELLHSGEPPAASLVNALSSCSCHVHLFRCCSTLGTLRGPGNPFVVSPAGALPWAFLIRWSEWLAR